MWFLFWVIVTLVGVGFGYSGTRRFVRQRLRYVDAVQGWGAPWIAALIAAVIAAPVVGILPHVGAGVALLFGASVGLGVSAGARDVRNGSNLIGPG